MVEALGHGDTNIVFTGSVVAMHIVGAFDFDTDFVGANMLGRTVFIFKAFWDIDAGIVFTGSTVTVFVPGTLHIDTVAIHTNLLCIAMDIIQTLYFDTRTVETHMKFGTFAVDSTRGVLHARA